ncbi:MAG: ABC transporter permease [Clostridiales bacterium]|nr:ABC transporter permease [Clostridiales bacterium]
MNQVQKKSRRAASIDFMPLIIAYVLLVVFFAFKSQHFFTVRNFLNIALYAANVGVLACTMTLVIVSGHIDLSIGSVIALAGVVMGKLMQNGQPVVLAVLACIAVGALTGLYNALLITRVKVNAFITTLAGMEVFRGIAYLVTNGKAITLSGSFIKAIGRGYTLGFPNAVILMLTMVILFALLSRYTTFGRRIYVIGGGSQVAYLSGINVEKNLSVLFVLNGIMGGIATLIYCSQLGSAMPSNASGMEFDVISAVILGGASLSGGKGSIIGALFGALLLGTLNNGMVMLDIHTYWQQVISGLVLVLAVVLDVIKKRREQRTV